MAKSMNQKLAEAKDTIKFLEKERGELIEDRNRYRRYFQGKFKWFLELHGGGKTPSMEWLIKDMAKFGNEVERFWDGWY